MTDISHERLLELLSYNPETGDFTWKVTRSHNARAGARTGRLDGRGYYQVCVDGKRYLAHRLAWFYVHREWPADQIDHINWNRSDNTLLNLRAVSRSVNGRNKRKASTSGEVVGVRFHKSAQKWAAWINDRPAHQKYLGHFAKHEDAVAARKRAEIEYDYHPNHGAA